MIKELSIYTKFDTYCSKLHVSANSSIFFSTTTPEDSFHIEFSFKFLKKFFISVLSNSDSLGCLTIDEVGEEEFDGELAVGFEVGLVGVGLFTALSIDSLTDVIIEG